jgi:DNA-binding CsgD family transcriptional regulator/PAS domain-containing protein
MTTIDDFSEIVRTVYDAAVEPGEWTVALDVISAAMGATGCALLTTGREQNRFAVRSAGTDPASMITYNDYYGALDYLPAALESVPVGTVATRDQLLPRNVVYGSEFFNDWAHPSDHGDGICLVLSRDSDGTSWMCAAAAAKSEPFGTPERIALARRLVPHLEQASRMRARLSELDQRHRDLVAAVESLSDGIVIVDGDGRMVHLNAAAESIVASGDGLCVRAGHLTTTVARTDDGALSHIVHQAFSSGRSAVATGGCLAVPRLSGQRPYLVRVIPLAPEVSGAAASPSALVLIVDPEREPEPELQALRRLYGLTKTEANIALRVLDGSGLGPIANELSVSLSTVRTHLQHVFDKTHTHRQAELVRLLHAGLAATRRPRTS